MELLAETFTGHQPFIKPALWYISTCSNYTTSPPPTEASCHPYLAFAVAHPDSLGLKCRQQA